MSAGVVEQVGPYVISGWARPRETPFPVVELKVGGHTVARARALHPMKAPGGEDALGFYFSIKELWTFVGPDDAMEAVVEGDRLDLAPGISLKAESRGRRTSAELVKLVSEGHVFNKKGGLQLSKLRNVAWQEAVLDTFQKLVGDFKIASRYKLFPMYGTLLGAVREKGFIGHDDDFDAAYFSRYTRAKRARQEIIEIASKLATMGYQIRLGRTCMKVFTPGPKRARIDIFHTYFNKDGLYALPFGYAGDTPYRKEDATEWTTATIGDRELEVPGRPEKMLAWLYGDKWGTPDPGFNWKRQRKKRIKKAFLTNEDRAKVYWEKAYATRTSGKPSAFAQSLAGDLSRYGAVVELGAGAGADARHLASRPGAPKVFAAERASTGFWRARALLKGAKSDPVLRHLDLCARGAMEETLAEARATATDGGPLLVFARGFFGSAGSAGGRPVLDVTLEAMKPGETLAMEINEFGPKVSGEFLKRRHQSRLAPDDVAKRLAAAGFEILTHTSAPGGRRKTGVLRTHQIVARKR